MTREEAIEEIKSWTPILLSSTELSEKAGEAQDVAISALSAEVRPNIHARWESDGHGHIICTACKGANVSTWKSRFCPMCGAIMDGEVEPKGAESEEVWNGYHGTITAPKGTFERIYEECKDSEDGI